MSDTERPVEWPVTFPDPDLDCNHQYHWDDADGQYRCMYCELGKKRPPERWMDANAERDGGSR